MNAMARLGGRRAVSRGGRSGSSGGFPWQDGDMLFAGDLNAAFLPVTGGVVSANVLAPPAAAFTLVQLVGANATNPRFEFDGFGGNGQITFRRTEGSPASPVAIGALASLGGLNFAGYDGATYSGTAAHMDCFAASAWTPSSHPTLLTWSTTNFGSTQQLEAMRLQPSGALSIGSPADNGVDLLQVDGPLIATVVKTPGYTVATLPSAVSNKGGRAYVTDATAVTFGAVVVGGGAGVAPVFSNGFAWVCA